MEVDAGKLTQGEVIALINYMSQILLSLLRLADLVVSVTNLDETNLVSCLIAKKLGAKHTIARVRNPEYRRDAQLLKQEIGLDMVINPDLAAAREIARILSFPSASSVEPFAGGRIDMIGIQVTERDRFYGVALSEFHRCLLYTSDAADEL